MTILSSYMLLNGVKIFSFFNFFVWRFVLFFFFSFFSNPFYKSICGFDFLKLFRNVYKQLYRYDIFVHHPSLNCCIDLPTLLKHLIFLNNNQSKYQLDFWLSQKFCKLAEKAKRIGYFNTYSCKKQVKKVQTNHQILLKHLQWVQYPFSDRQYCSSIPTSRHKS